jgi:hypothetical protein
MWAALPYNRKKRKEGAQTMMTETGTIGVRTSGRLEFSPQKNILGRTTTDYPHGGRGVVRGAMDTII